MNDNKLIAVAAIVATAIGCMITSCDKKENLECVFEDTNIIDTIFVKTQVDSWDVFVDAVIYVESRGRDSIVGDRGKAIGCLQIHPIMVREVNRILGKKKYTLDDRWNRKKSIEMFNIVSEEYQCCEEYTFMQYAEIVSRRWNGGRKGDRKESTKKYWELVKKRYKSQIKFYS